MEKEDLPKIDVVELEEKAKANPKTKNFNNPNSRANLKQYKKKEEDIFPEVLDEEDLEAGEAEAISRAEEITRGRKIEPKLVRQLMPKRNILTAAEHKLYTGVVLTFLSDFKNEEPTAADVADMTEIAMSQVMEMRLLEFCKNDPGNMVAASQTLERWAKRKQQARENLATRRTDRKDARNNQDINIVDLIVKFDVTQQEVEKQRLNKLLKDGEETREKLRKLVEEEVF